MARGDLGSRNGSSSGRVGANVCGSAHTAGSVARGAGRRAEVATRHQRHRIDQHPRWNAAGVVGAHRQPGRHPGCHFVRGAGSRPGTAGSRSVAAGRGTGAATGVERRAGSSARTSRGLGGGAAPARGIKRPGEGRRGAGRVDGQHRGQQRARRSRRGVCQYWSPCGYAGHGAGRGGARMLQGSRRRLQF